VRRIKLNDGWQVRPKVNRFAELAGGGVEWSSVTLPHDAMISTERAREANAANAYFRGGSWEYRRVLDRASASADVVMLEFEGVYRDAVVYVNGSMAGRRPYGYSCFTLPIDHLLSPSHDNEIRVEARAGDDSRWYSGAGIYRDVWLLQSGRVHLHPAGFSVRSPEVDDCGATLAVAAVVNNRSGSTDQSVVRVEVLDDSGAVIARDDAPITTYPGEAASARRRIFVANPRRWSPEDPYLYRCRATLLDGEDVLDVEEVTFGIRSLSLDPSRGLRVNGKTVLLRGACVHHDNGPLGSATIPRAEERRVELLKAAGFNAIRSAHNPMSRAMLAACDRLGMLVMDETFDMWTQSKSEDDYARVFPDWWEADVEALIAKNQNHPSVVLYSIGNEIPDGSTPGGLRVSRALADKVRSLDDTRFVTQAVTGVLVGGPELFAELRPPAGGSDAEPSHEIGVNSAATSFGELLRSAMRSPIVDERTVEAFSHLDVAGYNYMDTRFAIDAELHPNRVMVGTETYASFIDEGWAAVQTHPQVIGDFTWTGWDYLGEAGIGRTEYGGEAPGFGMAAFLGAYPWLTAGCGDLDITGHRRPQSYYREIVFGRRSDPYIAVHRPDHHGLVVTHASPWSWPDVVASWSWPTHIGAPVAVDVYAAADEVELLVNGRSVGRQPAGVTHRFRAQFDVVYEPGELTAVAWHDDRVVGQAVLRSASQRLMLHVQPDRDQIAADPSDLAFVALGLVDEAGTLHTTADRRVEVAVAGPAALQAVASANPTAADAFNGTGCMTFDGRAIAIVRPEGAGVITITATAEGCDPYRVQVQAR